MNTGAAGKKIEAAPGLHLDDLLTLDEKYAPSSPWKDAFIDGPSGSDGKPVPVKVHTLLNFILMHCDQVQPDGVTTKVAKRLVHACEGASLSKNKDLAKDMRVLGEKLVWCTAQTQAASGDIDAAIQTYEAAEEKLDAANLKFGADTFNKRRKELEDVKDKIYKTALVDFIIRKEELDGESAQARRDELMKLGSGFIIEDKTKMPFVINIDKATELPGIQATYLANHKEAVESRMRETGDRCAPHSPAASVRVESPLCLRSPVCSVGHQG